MERNAERVDRVIAVLLRTGVIAAASVVLAGGVWYLARFGALVPDFHAFRGEPHELRSVAGVWKGVLALHPLSAIQFGLLLLIATPIARVAFSMIAFALQRDKLYFSLTMVVLAVLVWSLSGMGYAPR
jgi:uncharacterized membrane protein